MLCTPGFAIKFDDKVSGDEYFEPLGDRQEMPAILVIEDDPATADEIRLELARHGFDVHVADNGQAALELARQHPWNMAPRMVPSLHQA